MHCTYEVVCLYAMLLMFLQQQSDDDPSEHTPLLGSDIGTVQYPSYFSGECFIIIECQ